MIDQIQNALNNNNLLHNKNKLINHSIPTYLFDTDISFNNSKTLSGTTQTDIPYHSNGMFIWILFMFIWIIHTLENEFKDYLDTISTLSTNTGFFLNNKFLLIIISFIDINQSYNNLINLEDVNNLTITPKQITPISSINNILQSTPIIIDFVDQVTSNVYNQQNDNDYNKEIITTTSTNTFTPNESLIKNEGSEDSDGKKWTN